MKKLLIILPFILFSLFSFPVISQAATETLRPNDYSGADMKFGTRSIYGVTYGSDKFVAVGTAGQGSYSTDGITWTLVSDMKFGTQYIYGVTYGGDKFVAVGSSGQGSYSSDGITWTAVSDMKFGTSDINSVTYGSDKFVAVGSSGQGSYSTDGITWTLVSDMKFGTQYIYGVTYGSDKFVAVGSSGQGSYSSDGITWTAVSDMKFGTGLGSSINGVTYGSDKFVAVGGTGKGSYSTDGITWTLVSDMKLGTETIYGVTYGSDKFVAVSTAGQGSYSSDGITWTAVSDMKFGTSDIKSVTYGSDKFVAVGTAGKGSYSSDGITWTSFPPSVTQLPRSGCVRNYQCVDEETTDDDSTFVYGEAETSGWLRDLYALPAHSGSGTINSVTVHARLKNSSGSNSYGKISIKTNGVTYDTDAYALTTSWANFSNTWTTNPQTGNAWTWAEIDALEAGVSLYDVYTSSCPFVYSWDGSEWHFDHEAFPFSVTKAGETTSEGGLYNLKPVNGTLHLNLREQLPETSWTNSFKVYSIDHGNSTSSVMPDSQNNFHTIKTRNNSAVSCVNRDGKNCLEEVEKQDSLFYTSDLTQNFTDPKNYYDWIDLEFNKPENASDLKLGLVLMKSAAVTFAWQNFINQIGKNNWNLFETLFDSVEFLKNRWQYSLGVNWRLNVEIWNGKEWIKADTIEAGREKWNDFLVFKNISDIKTDKLKIRLKSTSGFYEINYAFVDYSEDEKLIVNELVPEKMIMNDKDVTNLLSKDDKKYLEMNQGDSVDIEYKDLPKIDGMKRDYSVSAGGYYHFRDFTEHQSFWQFLKTVKNVMYPIFYEDGFESRYFMDLYSKMFLGSGSNDSKIINTTDRSEKDIDSSNAKSIVKGQPILMVDRSQKNIEDVKIGDEVISFDLDSQKVEKDKVIGITQGSHDDYLVFNGALKTSSDHVIWANGEFKEAKDIKVGDLLLDSSGNKVAVVIIKDVQKKAETYDLVIEKNHNFFASNYLVHNSNVRGEATQVYIVVDYTSADGGSASPSRTMRLFSGFTTRIRSGQLIIRPN